MYPKSISELLCAELIRQIYLLQGGSHMLGKEESGEGGQKEGNVCREVRLKFSH